MMDYWAASCDKTAFIGVRASNKEKLLVKSAEEYTSPISKILQVTNEYIVLTENSIYIVSKELPQTRIS
jgi:DeoR/GlpR family transcriptional regulator of sugar metabolism